MGEQVERIHDRRDDEIGGRKRLARGAFALHDRDAEARSREHQSVVAPVPNRDDAVGTKRRDEAPLGFGLIRAPDDFERARHSPERGRRRAMRVGRQDVNRYLRGERCELLRDAGQQSAVAGKRAVEVEDQVREREGAKGRDSEPRHGPAQAESSSGAQSTSTSQRTKNTCTRSACSIAISRSASSGVVISRTSTGSFPASSKKWP